MPSDGELATERTGSVPEGATVIPVPELPAPERSLVRTAIEEGVVRVCMDHGGERADALRSVADRVTAANTYLAADGHRYAVWLRITDLVYAGTASPPEGDADPCC